MDIDPENPYATINLGVVYEREGNVQGAREMYQKVLELNPGEEQQDEWRQSPYDALKQLARENIQHLRTSGQ